MKKKKGVEIEYEKGAVLTSKDKATFRKSARWIEFRNRIISERNHTCEMCGYTQRSTLHHIHLNDQADSYTNLSPEHFKVMCQGCHKFLHRVERSYHKKKDPIKPDKRLEDIINEFIIIDETSTI